jgi:hypothetical protein
MTAHKLVTAMPAISEINTDHTIRINPIPTKSRAAARVGIAIGTPYRILRHTTFEEDQRLIGSQCNHLWARQWLVSLQQGEPVRQGANGETQDKQKGSHAENLCDHTRPDHKRLRDQRFRFLKIH